MSLTSSSKYADGIDPNYMRQTYADLSDFSDAELVAHFNQFGREEGRISAALSLRENIVLAIEQERSVLEIGPFCSPVVKGEKVKYFDVLRKDDLERRAIAENYPGKTAPFIDFVSETGDLSIVNENFGAVVSSHAIEHQPDLISHLRLTSSILKKGGKYYALIPNKKYCFDYSISETSIADILQAHSEKRRVHTLASVVEHRALTTHNDCMRHWDGDHYDAGWSSTIAERSLRAIEEYKHANGAYVDVHAWQFTPSSFRKLMDDLYEMKMTPLQVLGVFETPAGRNEFTAILQK